MIDGFKIFAPRGSPRGQGPPRIKILHCLWQCLPLAARMIDGFKIFAPRGSPRGQGPPRIKFLHCPLAMPSPCGANDRWFQDICATGEPEGARPASDKIFALPLAMPSPCSANDRWFQDICAAGEPEGARPASDKIFASPSGDVSLHPRQTLPYGACPSIPFLKKRINILLDAYISAPEIRRKWAENRGQTPVKKLALDFKIFFSAFFKKKREMHGNVV